MDEPIEMEIIGAVPQKKRNVVAIAAFAICMASLALAIAQIVITACLGTTGNGLAQTLVAVALVAGIVSMAGGAISFIMGIVGAVRILIYGSGKAFAVTAIVVAIVVILVAFVLIIVDVIFAAVLGITNSASIAL